MEQETRYALELEIKQLIEKYKNMDNIDEPFDFTFINNEIVENLENILYKLGKDNTECDCVDCQTDDYTFDMKLKATYRGTLTKIDDNN